MKTAIIYYSQHHGNTKKLLDGIAAAHDDVTLLDVSQASSVNLNQFDRIGFASGIYYSKFHKTLLRFAESSMPENMPTFFLYTYGAEKSGYDAAIRAAVEAHHAKVLGSFGCFGFNTFGPFKLIGGIAKGHPDKTELQAALRFYESLG